MKFSLYSLLVTQQSIDKACAREDGDDEDDGSDINIGAAAGLCALSQDHRGGIYMPRQSPLPVDCVLVDLPAC